MTQRPGDAGTKRGGKARPGVGHALRNRGVVVPDQGVSLVVVQLKVAGKPPGGVAFQPGKRLHLTPPFGAVGGPSCQRAAQVSVAQRRAIAVDAPRAGAYARANQIRLRAARPVAGLAFRDG